MKYKIDHDYHIHSSLSSCSRDPEQSTENILRYAKENGLSRICVTNHYWDSSVDGATGWYKPQSFEHLSKDLPLPKSEGIRFMFGCESELKKDGTLGIPLSRFDDFDFVIIPTTHLQMKGFTISVEDSSSCETRARVWTERLDRLLSMQLPFKKMGIAHLACTLINTASREDYLRTLSLIPDCEMERLFAKAAEAGVGIELNRADMSFLDSEADTVLRAFRIAKHAGCKFYLGSDAHHPAGFVNAKEIFERAVTLLDLSESDKFIIE